MVMSAPAPTSMDQPKASRARPSLGHHRVVVIGGGTAGITVAARLAHGGQRDIAIIEPSDKHYYQPLWTLVGAGAATADETVRNQEDFIPDGARWIRGYAAEIDPSAQTVRLRSGEAVGYDFLVVAPGIQLDWDKVVGLREALATESVSSNYDFTLAPKTFRLIQAFRGGTALFTHPSGPIKCAGAPQKIMYLAADYFRGAGVTDRAKIVFAGGVKSIFAVAPFRAVLEQVIARYDIETRFEHNLVEVRPAQKEAIFEARQGEAVTRVTIPYDLLHAVPPQSAPDFVKQSPLAHQEGPSKGWVKADRYTLQHPDYPNVFALGDASDLPTSRTGAAIRKQAPVVVANLLAVMDGKAPAARYDGYASCPLVTAYDKVLLAEFDYEGRPTPSIPFLDMQKERYDMFLLKRHMLPWMYWNLMLRGLA